MNIVTIILVTLCINIAYSNGSVPKLNTPNVVLSSITNSSMVLHWYAPFNLENTPTEYEIQYSKLGDDWENVYGTIGSMSEPQHEILWIEVKGSDSAPINGSFRLYLNYYTKYQQPVHFVTNEIPFDAKADDIKTELEHLTGITNVHVIEGVPKHNSIVEGKSSWIVIYDYRHDIISGNIVPQLQVYDESMNTNDEREDIPPTLKGDIQCIELYTGNGKELSGEFSLHINGHEISEILVNITAEELENKLKGIFPNVKVERPNDYYSVLEYYGYDTDFQSWCITFSTEKSILPILIHPPSGNNGIVRIVQKYGEYKVTNVQIHELRRQGSNNTLCFGDCYQLIDNLYPNSGYIYRLKYKVETDDWSEYTSSSQIYYTLQYDVPSHPVPPLFISSTKTSINVECILSNDNGAKITDITFEISDENDKSFMWRKAEIVKTKRDFLHYTIIKLNPDSSYYVRVQMHNSAGASDYSNPSNLMKTQPDLPLNPPKIYIESEKTTTYSITLFWLPVKDNGIPVDSYSIQYKTQPFGFWNNIRYAVSAVNSNIKREIQTIQCNVPIKEIESTDTFTLEFGYKYSVDSIKPNRYKTKPLSFKCTAEEMKNALNAIRPHSIYHIDRIVENSRYVWRIYFNYYQQSFTLPYPLLRLSDASFYASDEYSESFTFMKIQEATPAVFKDVLSLKVDGLTNYTTYIFRCKANTIEGSTEWSEATSPETTKAITTLLPPSRIPSIVIPTIAATGRYAANREDPDYVGGIGNGGSKYSKGENGMIVISTCNTHGHLIPKSYYYYKEVNNEPVVQKYRVKAPPGVTIDCLEIKAWGAGGGGSKNSTGGGGGFAFIQMKTKNNEEYDILVGEGGYAGLKETGGLGGWPNGGKGGNGREAGGGGGGYSGVFYKGSLVVIAGSGGGGGSTDHLSSNGGHGGGSDGGDGDTPIIPIDKASGYAGYPPDYVHTDLEIYNTNDYDVLPSGGKAGTISKGGDSGRQSSFQYGENIHYIDGKPLLEGETGSFHPPTAGYSLTGGIGGSSLEGGGGGGAGYYGGGGGGAGIDGAGGGGGGSYVNITHMYKDPEDTTPSQDPQDIKPSFYVIRIMCNNITIGWNGAFIARNYPDVISVGIEFAVGLSTLNFTYVDVVPLLQSQFTVNDLIPMDIYRIRIFYVYRTLPISLYSDPLTFQTPLCRTNDWNELDPRPNINIKNESYRSPDYPIKAIPSPRRGHTLAVVDNYVYMFGGFTEGYNCEILHGYECYVGSDSKSYWIDSEGKISALDTTNELWKLNPMSMIFEELIPDNGTIIPEPRELHSASVVNNTIYIFGGRNGEDDNEGRDDFWALDIDSDEYRSFDYNNSTTLNEGKNVYTYIESSSNYSDSYCLSSINVTITINHLCVEELDIFLIKIANYELDGAGLKRLRLWRSNNNGICHNFTKVTFSDNGIDVSLLRKYENSIIKPIDLFSNFMNTHSSANFSLQIIDRVSNGNAGELVDWSISIASHHCPFVFNWRKIESVSENKPPRRYGHASIVLDNSIYIYGGYSKGVLHDLWRYDIYDNKWTELISPSDIHIPYSFRSMLVTPYNLMCYGGYSSSGYREVDQIDVLKRFTEEIEVSGNSTMNSKSHPVSRYMTSMVLTKSRYNEDQYIMYGGYDGIRIYGDLWSLTLSEWGNKRAELAKSYLDDHCRLLDSSLEVVEHWVNSCGAEKPSEVCNPYELLDYAFCKNTYQTIGFL